MVTGLGEPRPAAAGAGVAEPVRTLANLVTLVRTVAAVAVGMLGVATASVPLLAVGYAIYWVGDMLDGAVARARHEETRQGAVFDVVSDRACTSVLATGYVAVEPGVAVPLAVFLLQFMVLDCVLTLAFLRWPIVSPNYFDRVDRPVFRWNWSKPAKATNTAAVVLLVALGWAVAATAVALVVVVIKVWSLARVARLLRDPSAARPAVGSPVAVAGGGVA